MFSITKRSNAINYAEKDRENINELILAVQEKFGKQFSNIKESFEFLLNHALSEDSNTEIETETVEIIPDNALILDDNPEIFSQCTTLLREFANSHEIGDSSPAIQILKAVELSTKQPESIEIEKTIEVPIELSENQLLVNLNENQKSILEMVVENRRSKAIKSGKELNENPATILRDRFFLWDVLENWTSEFYTGLKRK